MGKTHWKVAFNPNYLGGWSLEAGKDKILTIDYVRIEECTFEGGRKENHNVAHFVEKEKPMILNAINCRTLTKLMKSAEIEDWKGRIQIYFDPSVKGKSGEITGGLRIRPTVPEDVKIPCEECGQFISPAFSMTATQLAAYTKKKYGKALCSECAQAKKKEDKPDGADQ